MANKDDFSLVSKFEGYRNREDITNLPPGYLVVGSQNVVTNTSGRIQLAKGYTLDGAASATLAGIEGAYDFEMSNGQTRNLRSYTDPSTTKGVLQYRYVSSTGAVTWRDLSTNLNRGLIRFTDYWDFGGDYISLMLFVDGTSNIHEWSGGVTTVASVTANTITKQGTEYWAEENFFSSGTRKVVINGIEYTYTGGDATVTLTGVTPDPTAAVIPIVAGDIVHQAIRTTANATCPSLLATLKNSLIANLRNQIYIAAEDFRTVYVSKVNDWNNFAYSAVRAVGQGATVTLAGNPKALIPQEDQMYISAGTDQWYNTQFTLDSTLASEAFQVVRLKTGGKQAAQSQEFCSKDKNNVLFVSGEPVLTSLGRVQGVISTPQMTDLSFPVINDFNTYDFTDGSVFYDRNFIYVAVPKERLIRIYNQTDPSKTYWEAPYTVSISRFSIIDGAIYGHSYLTPETYKLFDGYDFNGQPIPAIASFSYRNYGTRSQTKGMNEFYVEGYISGNAKITMTIKKEIDGCATEVSKEILGNDKKIVCISSNDSPLGKAPLGKNPLGSTSVTSVPYSLPPKFRVIKTFPTLPYFYEEQTSFSSSGVGYQWEIIGFGPTIHGTGDLNNNIKQ
jgi:hypothetical protein